jgi:hypothetical protein
MAVMAVLVQHQALLAQALPVLAVVEDAARLALVAQAAQAVVVLVLYMQLAVQLMEQQIQAVVGVVVLTIHNQRRLAGLVW